MTMPDLCTHHRGVYATRDEARDEFEAAYVAFHAKAAEAEERAEELSRVNLALVEREAAATREAKRLRLLVGWEGA